MSYRFRFEVIYTLIENCPYENVIGQLLDFVRKNVSLLWPLSKIQADENKSGFTSPEVMNIALSVCNRYSGLKEGEIAVRCERCLTLCQ